MTIEGADSSEGFGMQGILVHGGNHHILTGPEPDGGQARQLVFHLEFPDLLRPFPAELRQWQVLTKTLRERLCWAVVVASAEPHSDAVAKLLEELAARGLRINRTEGVMDRG